MECSDWCQEALEQTGADLGYTEGSPDFVDQVSVDFQNRTSPWAGSENMKGKPT